MIVTQRQGYFDLKKFWLNEKISLIYKKISLIWFSFDYEKIMIWMSIIFEHNFF